VSPKQKLNRCAVSGFAAEAERQVEGSALLDPYRSQRRRAGNARFRSGFVSASDGRPSEAGCASMETRIED